MCEREQNTKTDLEIPCVNLPGVRSTSPMKVQPCLSDNLLFYRSKGSFTRYVTPN